jgi:hypothetical protein
VELVDGPAAGSQVLLGGAAFVLDGDVVRPVGAGAPVAPFRRKARARSSRGRRAMGTGRPTGQLRISAWAIQNPIPVAVLFVLLSIAGFLSYGQLPIKQFPNVSFPAVAVTVTQNGASPSELENQVTRPVENALAGISGVDHVQSVVALGASTTTVNFEIGQDEQRALTRSAPPSIRPARTCRAKLTSRSCSGSSSRACRSSPSPWPRRR